MTERPKVPVDKLLIDHFTVVCLVAWPLNENEAKGDLVLIEISQLCLCKLLLIGMRTALLPRKKRRKVSIKTLGHLQPHFHSKDRQLSKEI